MTATRRNGTCCSSRASRDAGGRRARSASRGAATACNTVEILEAGRRSLGDELDDGARGEPDARWRFWRWLAVVAACVDGHRAHRVHHRLVRLPAAVAVARATDSGRSAARRRRLAPHPDRRSKAPRRSLWPRSARRMAAALRSSAAFVAVNNGESAGLEQDRDFLWRNRYLLSPAVTSERFTAAGLRASAGGGPGAPRLARRRAGATHRCRRSHGRIAGARRPARPASAKPASRDGVWFSERRPAGPARRADALRRVTTSTRRSTRSGSSAPRSNRRARRADAEAPGCF